MVFESVSLLPICALLSTFLSAFIYLFIYLFIHLFIILNNERKKPW